MEVKSLTGKTSIIIFGSVFHSLIMLILPVFLTRILTKDGFGTYQQIFLVFHILVTILVLGIPRSLYFFIPRLSTDKQWTFVVQSVILLFLIGLLTFIAFLLLSVQVSNLFNNPDLAKYLYIISLYFLFVLPVECFVPLMICLEKYFLATFQRIFFDIILACAIIIPAILNKGLDGIFYTLLISAPVNLLASLFFIIRQYQSTKFHHDSSLLKSQLGYALPIGFSNLIIELTTQLDKLMISSFFLPSTFAIYAVGAREVPFVRNITYSVSGVIQPKLVDFFRKNEMANFLDLIHRSIRKTALLLYPLFIFSFIIAEHLIIVFFTDNYLDSTLIFRIYLLTLLIRFVSLAPILLAMGLTREVIISSLITLFANVVLTLTLIQAIGIIGAAISSVVAAYLNFGYLLLRIKIRISAVSSSLIPWKILLRIISVSALNGIVLYPIVSILKPSILNLGISFIIYFGLYLFSGRLFQIISKEEMNQIKNGFLYLFKRYSGIFKF